MSTDPNDPDTTNRGADQTGSAGIGLGTDPRARTAAWTGWATRARRAATTPVGSLGGGLGDDASDR